MILDEIKDFFGKKFRPFHLSRIEAFVLNNSESKLEIAFNNYYTSPKAKYKNADEFIPSLSYWAEKDDSEKVELSIQDQRIKRMLDNIKESIQHWLNIFHPGKTMADMSSSKNIAWYRAIVEDLEKRNIIMDGYGRLNIQHIENIIADMLYYRRGKIDSFLADDIVNFIPEYIQIKKDFIQAFTFKLQKMGEKHNEAL